MATFASKTFNAASYAAFRPSYSPSLYTTILNYHRGPRTLALDLGCGHGVVSRALAPHFDRVLATDPSEGMIAKAREEGERAGIANMGYEVAAAERLSSVENGIEDGIVDLVVAGQAAHWFDFEKAWPELRRVVREGGTMAFWGYRDPVIVGYPDATRIWLEYTYGDDRDKALGTYWEEPGRSILRDSFTAVKVPTTDWEDEAREYYEADPMQKRGGKGNVFVEKRLTLRQCMAYYRTYSSFHSWKQAHPEQKSRDEGGDGDLVDECLNSMMKAEGWKDKDFEVDLEWGSVLIMARRREQKAQSQP